jgi:hypothetical protein
MTTTAKLENGLPDPLIAEVTSLKAALARYQVIIRASNGIYAILLFLRLPQIPPTFTCNVKPSTYRHWLPKIVHCDKKTVFYKMK